MTFEGVVYGLNGVPLCTATVTADQILDGFAEVTCFECLGDPRGFELPDGTFQKCGRCKSRRTELVMA